MLIPIAYQSGQLASLLLTLTPLAPAADSLLIVAFALTVVTFCLTDNGFILTPVEALFGGELDLAPTGRVGLDRGGDVDLVGRILPPPPPDELPLCNMTKLRCEASGMMGRLCLFFSCISSTTSEMICVTDHVKDGFLAIKFTIQLDFCSAKTMEFQINNNLHD